MTSWVETVDAASQPGATYDAVVVGAGFAGMAMLYQLREIGMSARVYETGADVGGTWYWNCYPGARVDSPSMQYSFSFSPDMEQEWLWDEEYSDRGQLYAYLRHVADRFDLRRDIQFETTVTAASYDEKQKRWLVETSRGDRAVARFLITAAGCLSAVNVPDFAGLESFKGEWYHTSRWPQEGVDLSGKRILQIGTGSTGVQIAPMLAEVAEHLTVFQRTPNFSLPANNKKMNAEFEAEWKRNYAIHRQRARESPAGVEFTGGVNDCSALSVSDEEREASFEEAWNARNGPFVLFFCFNDLLASLEANDLVAEFVRKKIREKVDDPVTAELLCPKDHPFGTKRPPVDTNYFETFNRPNVALVDVKTNPIAEIMPRGLKLENGDEYEGDVIVFATGFDALTGALVRMNIAGREGVRLGQKWAAGPRTYLGVATAGFPNMFTITGPGSPAVLSNMTTSIEQHAEWIRDALVYLREHDLDSIEADVDAEDAWVEHVKAVADQTLFKHAKSWFRGANIPGKPLVFLPYAGGVGNYRSKCDEVAANGYEGFSLSGAPTAVLAEKER